MVGNFSFLFFIVYTYIFQLVNGSTLQTSHSNKKRNNNNNDLDNVNNKTFDPVSLQIGTHLFINESSKSKKKKKRNVNNLDDIYILTDILSQLIPMNFAFTKELLLNGDSTLYKNTPGYLNDDNVIFLDMVNIYGDTFHDSINPYLSKAKPIKGCEQDIINNNCENENILKCLSLKNKNISASCQNSLNDTLLYSCTTDIDSYCKDISQFSKIYNCLINNFYLLSNKCSNSLNYYEAVIHELHNKNISSKDNEPKKDNPETKNSFFYSFFKRLFNRDKNPKKNTGNSTQDKTIKDHKDSHNESNIKKNNPQSHNNESLNKYSLMSQTSRLGGKSERSTKQTYMPLIVVFIFIVVSCIILALIKICINRRIRNERKRDAEYLENTRNNLTEEAYS